MIYLNNAATSYPKPQSVIEAVTECLSRPLIHSSRTGLEREKDDYIYLCRENLAKIFNVKDPLHIVFSSGSTESLNLAIKGLNLKGSNVVTTAIEHNSVLRPLKTMELYGEISISVVMCNEKGYIEPDWFNEAITPNTKAVVVNHCSNVTGTVLDIKEIAKIVHKNGAILIVDASQSAGSIPIDFDGWDIDLLAFTGHKSLFGIQGIGGLCIKEGIELKPLKVGGTGILSEVLLQPDGLPIYYEAGTPNTPGIMSLWAGTEFILNEGLEKIHYYKSKLVKKMIKELSEIPEVKIYNDPDHSSFSNFCFNIEGMVPEEVGYMLDSSFDIMVRTGLHCAPLILEPLNVFPWGTVRASPSYFTKEEEIDAFIKAVKDIVYFVKRKKMVRHYDY